MKPTPTIRAALLRLAGDLVCIAHGLVNDAKKATAPRGPGRPAKLSPADIDHACQLYSSGESPAQIGKRYGVSDMAIRYHLKKRGLIPRRTP